MSSIGDNERQTQNRLIKMFENELKYLYLGNFEDIKDNSNVLESHMLMYLIEAGYSDFVAKKAIFEFVNVSRNDNNGLYYVNKVIYTLLKYGVKVNDENDNIRNVYFINWNQEEINKNHFYIAEEVTVVGVHEKRPDIVVYVNGIALSVIELKRSSISVSEGIRQNLTNQRSDFISRFFTTIQIILAANDTEGARYGVIETPEKYYLDWKNYKKSTNSDDIEIYTQSLLLENSLDQQIYSMFFKRRFLEIIYSMILFDQGIKKICRHNQYFGIKESQTRIQDHEGGIIWHTQGSGKSLTMVWLAKWILEKYSNARVLIITDREELDDQIEKVFIGVEEKIVRTTSGKDLILRLNLHEDRLMCSLIHKFGRRGDEISDLDYDKFIEELYAALPEDFNVKGDVFVFVDECHRTQSGKLHKVMKAIMPSSVFVGFTGTPLMKKDKAKSIEIFGSYIHTYKFDEAVQDEVVLDLRYEPRDIPQEVISQEKIDVWFDAKTRGLSPRAKAILKSKWATMQKVFSSKGRLQRIANDIYFDMETKTRLAHGHGNAMLVAGDIYSACKYYEIFQNMGFKRCAIVTSYIPSSGDLRTETTSLDEDTESIEKYEIYQRMLNGKDVESFEKEVKEKFIKEPGKMKLLIVVDKLLTGFDAPPATYLYIDKSMRDHGLFQAICRVNRLDGDEKEFGYIIDYKGLFGNLEQSVLDYTSGALDGYEKEDIEGLIKNRLIEAQKHFEDTLKELDDLCYEVDEPKRQIEYINYFCGESGKDEFSDELYSRNRERLYKLVSRLGRAYEEIKPDLGSIGYNGNQLVEIENRVVFYISLREEIGLASGDFIDLKQYEPGMRHLIDTYITASESEKIIAVDNFSLMDFILKQQATIHTNIDDKTAIDESVASTIENNIRKKIIEKNTSNPIYYEKMSTLLDYIILERKKGVLHFKDLLDEYIKLLNRVDSPELCDHYPESIKHNGPLRAFYDYTKGDIDLSMKIHQAVIKSKQSGFRGDVIKSKKIKRELFRIFNSQEEVEKLFKLISNQLEY